MKIPAFAAPDKVLHFAVGTLCTTAGIAAGVLALRFGSPVHPALAGFAACAAAALAREAWNKAHGGAFSWADIAATMAGGPWPLFCFWLGGVAHGA